MCGLVLGVPLLPLLDSGAPRATDVATVADRTVSRRASRSAAAPRPAVRLLDLVVAGATSTTTTAPPPPPPPPKPKPATTTTKPTVKAAAKTASKPPASKPAAPAAKAPAPVAAAAGNEQSGKASWYSAPGQHVCAHRTLPKGTIVNVRATATGRTTTCRVNDRGPYVAGRIIDLDRATFAALASTNDGVIDVTITW